ncbi:MAG: alanine--glyoxylate aminotransferase family protein [Myxococcales bacterium]|nr:alanine--glyoxylate aminotransferase family protein [Myxococcales bacterium]
MSLPILFTPGPVRIPPVVAAALAEPPCNYHRQAGFREMFAEIQTSLATLLGLRNPANYFATMLTTTGTGAVEGCMQAFAAVGPGLILDNGFFGARWVDQAKQNRFAFHALSSPSDAPIDPAAVAAYLDAHPDIKWCFYVSHETRMGLVNPMVEIGRVCKARGVMVGADIISSAFAYPVDIEAAELDLAVTSSAKAVQAVAGLGVVFVRLAALPALKAAAAADRPRSYYLDIVAECERQQAEHQPRFAQPVPLYAALHAACRHLLAVGIDNHMARIQRQMDTIARHLAQYGCAPLLPRDRLSWIAVNFSLPSGIKYSEFAPRMQAEGFFLLYGVPGNESHFQVSTIGDLTDADVAGLLRAFDRILAPIVHARPAAEAARAHGGAS